MTQQLAVNTGPPPTLDSQREFLQALIDSGRVPFKTVEEGYTITTYGRELGFSPLVSGSFIINIGGKLSLLVKGMKALLLQRGIAWKTIYDGAYLYTDGSIEEYKIDKGEVKPMDRISKIEFYRNINGYQMVETGTFSYKEADVAGLIKPNSGWTKYIRAMISSRAFSNGADKIAADVLLGLYSADELVGGIDEKFIKRDSDGEVESVMAEVVS